MDKELCQGVAKRIREIAQKYQGTGLTEQDTKNALIEPLLAAFGWPKDDLERVRAEYRHTARSTPADYALMSQGRPVLLVEAKALDVATDDIRFVAQVLTYANMAGAEWALLTNGQQWDLYAVLGQGEVRNKRIFSTTVADDDFLDWLAWICPERVEASELDRFWRLLVAERTVKACVTKLFRERSDALVQLLAQQTGIHVSDVATALQTLRLTFDGPSMEGRREILSSIEDDVQPTIRSHEHDQRTAEEQRLPGGRRPENQDQHGLCVSLNVPPSGRKPSVFSIGDRSWQVTTWRDLLVHTMEYLHATRPDGYEGLFADPAWRGRKRDLFNRETEGLKAALPIPGGFVEGNHSAGTIIRFVNRLLVWGEFDGVVSYTLRE